MKKQEFIKIAEVNNTIIYGDMNAHKEVANEIKNEQARTIGLSEFSNIKHNEHQEFLGRLTLIKEHNYKQAGDIVQEVLNGINEAEADTTLKGDFRETNLDWAYSKRYFAREYFSTILNTITNPNAQKYLSTSCRKLAK